MEGTERREVLYTEKRRPESFFRQEETAVLWPTRRAGMASLCRRGQSSSGSRLRARPRRFSLGKHLEVTKLRPGTALHMISPNSEGNGQIGRAWAAGAQPAPSQPRLAVSTTQAITAAGLYKSLPSPIYNVSSQGCLAQ
jgi:hypothetical protein